MRTVVGLFDTFEHAQTVADDLVRRGFSRNDISIVSNDAAQAHTTDTPAEHTHHDSGAEGATTGAVIGTGIGAVAGLAALAIPGIGPVVAAGPLLAALGGAGIGAVTGGLLGGLADAGVPEEHAEIYAEGVRRGGALVMVTTDEHRAEWAIESMNRHSAVNIEERAAKWRDNGWSGYDPNAAAYGLKEVEAVRTSRDQLAAGELSGHYDEYMGKNVTGHGRTDNVGAPTTNAMAAAEEIHEDFKHEDERNAQPRSRHVRYYEAPTDAEMTDSEEREDLAHFNENYLRSGYTYNEFTPAYTYGRALAADDRYQGREWNDIERDARREWESDNPDTWDVYNDAMRVAYGRARMNQ